MSTTVSARSTVSVCILCYNQGDIISRTIESVIAQRRKAEEILVLDDGSQDHSVDIISKYPEVKLVRHLSNQGRPKARNTLLHQATGEILVYVDGDALAAPDMVEALLSDYGPPDVGGVGGRGIEANIRTIYDRWRKRHATQQWPGRLEAATFLWGLCYSYRRDLIVKAGGYLHAGEDLDLSYRIRRLGYRLVYTPNAIVYHQRTDDLQSLLRMMHRWWYGGYIADYYNGRSRLVRDLRDLTQQFIRNNYEDLYSDPDWKVAWLNFIMPLAQAKALAAAVRFTQKGNVRGD